MSLRPHVMLLGITLNMLTGSRSSVESLFVLLCLCFQEPFVAVLRVFLLRVTVPAPVHAHRMVSYLRGH